MNMARSTFQHAKISGLGAVVPREEVRLEDELEYFGGDIKKARRVTKMVGIDRRRVAGPGVTPSDLCRQAAENLIADMELRRDTVDALIFVTQHPDYVLPATACILQNKLGLPQSCAAFDVNQGCAGYVYGLWLAFSLVEAGAASRILLLAGDGMSRLYDRDNRIVAPLFGDCGTATVVERTPEKSSSWFVLGTDGSGADALVLPAGGARLPLPLTIEEYSPYCERLYDAQDTPWRLNWTYMDNGAIFDFTLNVVPEHIADTMTYAGKKINDVDWFVPHQANRQIMSVIAAKTGFAPEKTLMESFGKYGNTAVATIPLAICDSLAEKTHGQKLNLLLSGFGVGLSWASVVLELNHIHCAGVRNFILPDNHPMPEEILERWRQKITDKAKQ
jgi:3-oxoacyl-[acyl-carrier-protein] synthase-3